MAIDLRFPRAKTSTGGIRTMANNESQEPIEMLRDRIKGIRMAMLGPISDGQIVTRPMSTQEMDSEGTLWFLTSASSPKIDDIEHYPRVNVAYCDSSSETY